MTYKEFYEELRKQINLNAKYFKAGEVLVFFDLLETINEEDFDKEQQK